MAVSTLAGLLWRMREYADSLPDELDLGIPHRRDKFTKLTQPYYYDKIALAITNKEETG